VADGNFKADHVRQKNVDGDVWLSEGGGMIPKRDEYQDFLRTAIERLTVRACFLDLLVPLIKSPFSAHCSKEGTLSKSISGNHECTTSIQGM
jgi:hypothetical protein